MRPSEEAKHWLLKFFGGNCLYGMAVKDEKKIPIVFALSGSGSKKKVLVIWIKTHQESHVQKPFRKLAFPLEFFEKEAPQSFTAFGSEILLSQALKNKIPKFLKNV
jgi:hypothetical protein